LNESVGIENKSDAHRHNVSNILTAFSPTASTVDIFLTSNSEHAGKQESTASTTPVGSPNKTSGRFALTGHEAKMAIRHLAGGQGIFRSFNHLP
jgi:hypothetical protein